MDASGAACEWVSATEAAASIPFGAVSHLLPPRSRLKRDPATLFALVEKQFADRRGSRPVIIGIDDAHLLDDASAGLLHQLAVHGLVKALATVRGGELVSDALAALWKGGGSRIEVRPLPATAVDHLLDQAVPGPLDVISRTRLRRLADGNPLLLRELLADAVETGALRPRQGIWRWHGAESGSPRLAELVSARLRWSRVRCAGRMTLWWPGFGSCGRAPSSIRASSCRRLGRRSTGLISISLNGWHERHTTPAMAMPRLFSRRSSHSFSIE